MEPLSAPAAGDAERVKRARLRVSEKSRPIRFMDTSTLINCLTYQPVNFSFITPAADHAEPRVGAVPIPQCYFTSMMFPIFHERSKKALVGEYQRK